MCAIVKAHTVPDSRSHHHLNLLNDHNHLKAVMPAMRRRKGSDRLRHHASLVRSHFK